MKHTLRYALAFLLLTSVVAFGQKKPEPTKPAQPTQTEPTKTEPQKKETPGETLAEKSKEAEGGDEDAAFKYSASVQWFASHTGMSKEAAYWLFLLINFAIIAGLIVYMWRKNIPGMMRTRTDTIKKGMDEARAASEEATRRLADVEARLARLDNEIATMRSAAERDGAAEEARLKAAAEEERKKIVSGAEQEIAAAAKQLRGEIKRYAAELALDLAAKRIKVSEDDDEALLQRLTEQLTEEKR